MRPHSCIEVLENRIAPATLTATLVGTKLKIVGTDGAEEGGLGSMGATGFNIGTLAGTTLIYNGTTVGDAASLDIASPITDVTVDLGGGDDSFESNFPTISKSFTVKGGAGQDTLKFVGVSVLGSLTIDAGADDDTVLIEGETHVSKLDVNLGEGSNTVELNFLNLFAEKSVAIKAGAGDDLLKGNLSGGYGLRSAGDFSIALGAGNDTVNLGTPVTRLGLIETGGKFTITGGQHAGTFTATVVAENLRVGGEFSVATTGPGANSVAVDAFEMHVTGKTTIKSTGDVADTVSFSTGDAILVGPVTFDLGGGANTTSFSAFTAAAMGSLTYKGGDGNDSLNFSGAGTRAITGLTDLKFGGGENVFDYNEPTSIAVFGGGLALTSGGGKDTFKLQNAHLTIGGKGAKISTGAGDNDVLLSAGMGSLTVYGGVVAAIGGGTSSLSLTATFLTVRGGVNATFADGASTFSLAGATDIGGALNVVMKGGGDDVIDLLTGKLSVRNAVSFTGDAGKLTASVTNNSGFRVGQLNFTTKAGGGTLSLPIGGQILGDFNYKGGAGPNGLVVGDTGSFPLDIFGKVNITSGTTTGSELFLFRRATVAGAFTAKFGAADTKLELDDALFGAAVSVDTGAGADTIDVQLNTMIGGTVVFRAPFKFTLGAGNDVVTLGNTGGVMFTAGAAALAKVLIDGGGDNDTLNSTNFSDGVVPLTVPTKNIETTTP